MRRPHETAVASCEQLDLAQLESTLVDASLIDLYREKRIAPTKIVPFRPIGSGVYSFLKLESQQPDAGSFKIRGEEALLDHYEQVDAETLYNNGVVIASAGNAALGAAIACNRRGIPLTVFAPKDIAKPKAEGVLKWGAKLDQSSTDVDQAIERAEEAAASQNRLLLKPYDNPHVVLGQSTVGSEILLRRPRTAKIFAAFGGGSLATGVGMALLNYDQISPLLEPREAYGVILGDATLEKPYYFETDHLPEVRQFNSKSDGTAVGKRAREIWPLTQSHVKGIIVITEAQLGEALVSLQNKDIAAEPAGAQGLAGMMAFAQLFPREATKMGEWTAVVSGANADPGRVDKLKSAYYRATEEQLRSIAKPAVGGHTRIRLKPGESYFGKR